MRSASTKEHRAERRAAAGFVISAVAAGALATLYWAGGQPQLEGALLAVAFGGVAFGLVTWANHLLPSDPVTGERHALPSRAEQREGLEDDLERGGVLSRRRLLVRTLSAAGAALGAALVFPIRSLGPAPGRSLLETPWRDGLRLVTDDGTPVRVSDVPVDGLVTVFPEGSPGSADGQAVLIRVGDAGVRPRPGRESWSPDGFVAYSKICTHAGCPVGLYESRSHQLLCPCHQSTFDVLDGARPVFGPAAVSLPQLPLRIEGDELVAMGDFSEPVGPAFWGRK